MLKYSYYCILFILFFFQIFWAQDVTISGFVVDSTNGESLVGANILLEGHKIGAISDERGYFVLHPVPVGNHFIEVSYLGYKTNHISIFLTTSQRQFMQVALSPVAITGSEVVITGEKLQSYREVGVSQIELSAQSFKRSPQLLEADLLRTLQALPGVVAQSDFSTGMIVRGGNTDQNLIMLDGITIYNPSHMGGLFSNFLIDAIKDAKFIKGGFPAEFGGRMSSVLNVLSRTGNSKKLSGSAGISLLSSRLNFESPLAAGALLISGRRTYFDQVLKLMNKKFPYYFYDFQGSFYQDFSPYNRITVSGYLGDDMLDWDELNFDLKWGNRTLAVNLRHIFSGRFFSNFQIAYSRFNTRVQLGGDQGVNSRNEVEDFTLKGDLSYFFSSLNHMKFGFELKRLKFMYNDVYDNQSLFSLLQKPSEMGIYLQNEWKINSDWLIFPGIRISYYNYNTTKLFFEPRFSVKYSLAKNQYLSFASGIYRQFIFTVQDEYNPSLINSWFAIDETVKAGRSFHCILGYEREFWGTTKLQVELYYKSLRNMLTYRERRSTVDEPLGKDIQAIEVFVPTNGYSYGAELFIHKEYGSLAGWIGYTLNWARSEIDQDLYYASFDRRHNIDLLLSYNLGRRWRLGLRFNYGSGFPYTRVEASYEEHDGGLIRRRLVYGKRNRFRYPAYHRLDLSFTKDFAWVGLKWQFETQIINLYYRKNVFLYEWDFDKNPAERTSIPMLPFFPTVGISLVF
jgi:hypothetical protein